MAQYCLFKWPSTETATKKNTKRVRCYTKLADARKALRKTAQGKIDIDHAFLLCKGTQACTWDKAIDGRKRLDASFDARQRQLARKRKGKR